MKWRKSLLLTATVFFVVITAFFQPVAVVSDAGEPFSDKEHVYDLTSGYADELYFKIIEGEEQQILDLFDGEIDLMGTSVDVNLLPPLMGDPEIAVNMTNGRRFGAINFNCTRAPMNWSVLRQAFAYALDKDGIQVRVHDSMSRSVDSPVPPSLGYWSLDNQPWSKENKYYEPDRIKGNALLDAAGFNDTDSNGWREDPNGNAIEFPIYSLFSYSGIVAEIIVAMSVEAFRSIGIKAYASYGFSSHMYETGDFHAAFWEYDPVGTEPFFLEDLLTNASGNVWHFVNSTFDNLVGTLFSTTDLGIAKQAAWDAQKILWEEQPLVITDNPLLVSAYRADPWTGWVNTQGAGVIDHWTYLKTHLKPKSGGTSDQYTNYSQGGRFNVSLPEQINSTNPLNSSSPYTKRVLNLVYDTLYKRNPYSLEECPWLAKDWLIEEIPADYSAIPRAEAGDRQKTTFYLHDNLTWHDGQPLTAEDVKYSYGLVKNTGSPAYLSAVAPVTHVEVVNDTLVEIFTDTGGLFTFHGINIPILPEHVWKNVASPLTWNNPEPLGSGPYKWKEHDYGALLILERNDDFIYNPRNYPFPEPEESTTTTRSSYAITAVTTTLVISIISIYQRKKRQ